MHSDITLDILDQQTTDLGEQFCRFKANVCTAYQTQELNHEVDTWYCQQAKEAAKRSEKDQVNATMEGMAQKPRTGVNNKGKEKSSPGLSQDALISKQSCKTKSFNFGTYKFYALGDYVTSICYFGTTDSYSTEPVSHIPLLIHVLTQFLQGRVRALYAERQILLYQSKDVCLPVDSDQVPPGMFTLHQAMSAAASPSFRGE
jgi:hypothetical protein